jgi:RNA polymerase sigma-70 factor (ECF subfamily)
MAAVVSVGDLGPAATGEESSADAAEIGAFYDREMPQLVLFVRAMFRGLDAHAAADVAQTAFERALPRWAGLRHPRAWLYKVAQHEAMARCAAIRREVPADVLPDRPGEMPADLAAEWREEQREVWRHLQSLTAKQRQVMTWTLAGFSTAEIASALGLSQDAVRQHRHYARRNLRRRLGSGRDGR